MSDRVVAELRHCGHDVLTMHKLGLARQSYPDPGVLLKAGELGRVVLTMNRKHFSKLHRESQGVHTGIMTCTADTDYKALATRIDSAASEIADFKGLLVRVERSGWHIA